MPAAPDLAPTNYGSATKYREIIGFRRQPVNRRATHTDPISVLFRRLAAVADAFPFDHYLLLAIRREMRAAERRTTGPQ